ncbi:unnamed protein product [Sphenostylis stenocarpa]|uniref:Uncharacterized protein n=1 Tax=Sphenostylis stenocarpa TaxID=92480 RepID=A0AA86THQ4_9FABA|nr:unnamed protein product [Sphenostylis stenocarpa]
MSKTTFITGVLAIVFLLLSPSTAMIKTITISSDTRPTILFQKFGFTNAGHATVAASSVSVVAPSAPDLSRLGFLLISDASLPQVLTEIGQHPSFCILDSHSILRLFTFNNLSLPPSASFNRTYPITISGEYSLFFVNCAFGSAVTMVVHIELYNHNTDGSRDYLSSGHTHLRSLFSLFSIAYFFFFATWLYLCHVNNRSLHRVHLYMALLLLVKALSFLCAAVEYQSVKVNGTTHSWDFFHIFDFASAVFLFTVVVLVGTRWTFLHPVVRERGKKALFVVIPLQALAHVAFVVILKTRPYSEKWVTWNQVFLLLDFIANCAMVFFVGWSMRSLTKTSTMQEEPAVNLHRFTLIRRFYIIVIGYILFTRFGIFALKTVVADKYEWVDNLVEEIATLVFCNAMFYVFWVVEKDEYSVMGEEELKPSDKNVEVEI